MTFLWARLFTVFSVSHKYLEEALLRGGLPFHRRLAGIAAELPEPQIPGDKRRRPHYKPRGSPLRDDVAVMWNAEGLDGVLGTARMHFPATPFTVHNGRCRLTDRTCNPATLLCCYTMWHEGANAGWISCVGRFGGTSILLLICFAVAQVVCWGQGDEWYLKPLFPLAAGDLRMIDVRPLLDVACPGKAFLRDGKDGREMGCSTCPPGSDFYIDRDTMSQSLEAVTFGHFTSGIAEDAILSVSGCESHGNYHGGSYLLTKNAGRWRRLGYTSRIITGQCHKIATEGGREILVCSHYFGGQGYIERFLYAIEFELAKKPRITPLLTGANGLRACGQAGEKGNLPVPQSIIESVSFRDGNGDDLPGVSIFARTGKIQRSDAEYRACVDWSIGRGWQNPPPVRTPEYRIDFVLQGSRLILSPGSATAIKHFPHSDMF